MTTRVAVVQMVSGHVVADNLERARLRVLEAARGGAALSVASVTGRPIIFASGLVV